MQPEQMFFFSEIAFPFALTRPPRKQGGTEFLLH